MGRKTLRVLIAVCLTLALTISFPAQAVAAGNRVNPDDLLSVLNDITASGQAWESIGFSAEDIAELSQLPKKDDSFYQSINEQIEQLSVETEQTVTFENALKTALSEQTTIGLLADNGNPPESPEEQNERLRYVTEVALAKYGHLYNTPQFEKYVLYLYMSHYIDNPSYSRENPGFDHILAHIITSDDVLVYDNFVALSRFSMFASNLVNFAYEIKSSVDTIGDVKAAVNNGKIISFNTANAVYGLASFSPGDSVRRGDLIVTSFKNHYESVASVAELLDAIYADLVPEDVEAQYIDACIFGLLGLLAGTASLFGFGLSISLVYYNIYMNIYDRARLAGLHYSLSGRIAARVYSEIWG